MKVLEKLRPAEGSLFALLLRSPWWISIALAVLMSALAVALLPERFRTVGAVSGLPFAVIGLLAARRQWRQPSAARVDEVRLAVTAMTWPVFSALLEQAFQREGYTVQRSSAAGADFELARQGRRTLVCARRWKAARLGLEPLRALQAARQAADVSDALFIGLGDPSDTAMPFLKEHGIQLWRAGELAQSLRGMTLPR